MARSLGKTSANPLSGSFSQKSLTPHIWQARRIPVPPSGGVGDPDKADAAISDTANIILFIAGFSSNGLDHFVPSSAGLPEGAQNERNSYGPRLIVESPPQDASDTRSFDPSGKRTRTHAGSTPVFTT